jgi:hypothetical protein
MYKSWVLESKAKKRRKRTRKGEERRAIYIRARPLAENVTGAYWPSQSSFNKPLDVTTRAIQAKVEAYGSAYFKLKGSIP